MFTSSFRPTVAAILTSKTVKAPILRREPKYSVSSFNKKQEQALRNYCVQWDAEVVTRYKTSFDRVGVQLASGKRVRMYWSELEGKWIECSIKPIADKLDEHVMTW